MAEPPLRKSILSMTDGPKGILFSSGPAKPASHQLCLSELSPTGARALCMSPLLGAVNSLGHHAATFTPVAFSASSTLEKTRTWFYTNREILLF